MGLSPVVFGKASESYEVHHSCAVFTIPESIYVMIFATASFKVHPISLEAKD